LEWLHFSNERPGGHALPAAEFYNLEFSDMLDLGREYITWRQWVFYTPSFLFSSSWANIIVALSLSKE